MVITYTVRSFWRLAGTWLIGANVALTGIYLGLAIGTVDWTHASTHAGPLWQFWWTPPLIMSQVGLIRQLVASQSSPWRGARG